MVVTQPTASTDSTCSPPAIAPLRWLSCRCHLYADLNPRLSARSAVKIDWEFAFIRVHSRENGLVPFLYFVCYPRTKARRVRDNAPYPRTINHATGRSRPHRPTGLTTNSGNVRRLSCRCHVWRFNPRSSARSAVNIDWEFAVVRVDSRENGLGPFLFRVLHSIQGAAR
jgi:hypothetical protein